MAYYRCRAVTTALAPAEDVDDDDAEQPQWRALARLGREGFHGPHREAFDTLRCQG